ncbi:MAG: hypothetical protein R3F13_04230 [Prosthecobacter sp.]
MSDRPFISHFSPQRTDPELLEQIHVQRHDLLAESVARVRESVLSQNKHHLLFIGPRGAGKTHLVRLIHHRLSQEAKTQPELAERLRFAWLHEDETATSFLKLLILIYRDLTQRYPQEFPAADLQSIYGQSADIARESLGQALLRHLGPDRTLVVLMENLDSLFKHMPEIEQRTWRAFVQNHPVFTTVGTAQSLFDGVSDRDQPFFGFFDTQHLIPLNVEDAVQLLTKLARINGDAELADYLQTPTGHARVQAIHDLAGGNPRIYLIFSELLTKESLDDLIRPFEETADRQLTSYYQERLRWLSAQQQEIIQFLCHHSQPIPVKNIAEGLFTTHNSITGQLKLLREMRYVTANQKGREVLYELTEPLMRLALQVKETHDRKPLTLIVDFLRVWYDRGDLEQRLSQHKPGSPGHAYFAEALARLDSSPINLRHEILRRGIEVFDPEHCDDAMLAKLLCLATETNNAQEWLALSAAYIVRANWNEVISCANKAISHSNGDNEIVAMSLYNRGVANDVLGQKASALSDWMEIAELSGVSNDQIANALTSLANLKGGLGMLDDAMDDCLRVLSMQGVCDDLFASAHIGLGVILARKQLPVEAIAAYTKGILMRKVTPKVLAMGLYNRAVENRRIGNLQEALNDCDRIISLQGIPPDHLALGLTNRAAIKLSMEDYDAVVQDCSRVIGTEGLAINQTARALFLRAMAYQFSGRLEAALDDYERPFLMPTLRVHSEVAEKLPDFFANLDMTATQVVGLLLGLCLEPSKLVDRIGRFAISFSKFDSIQLLGDALINHLPTLARAPLNHDGFDTWAECWTSACAQIEPEDQTKMEIPLRLLHTGIGFLKTKDENSLLLLPLEERRVLRKALQLPPERSE